MKLYPWLDHLNWAPAPSDPTLFKASWERGPPFPRESPEEEKGGCSCLMASYNHTPFSCSKEAAKRERGQRSHQPTFIPAYLWCSLFFPLFFFFTVSRFPSRNILPRWHPSPHVTANQNCHVGSCFFFKLYPLFACVCTWVICMFTRVDLQLLIVNYSKFKVSQSNLSWSWNCQILN